MKLDSLNPLSWEVSFNFSPLKVRHLWRQSRVQTLPRDWGVHMCLQRGQGGGFDTNCCCCCCWGTIPKSTHYYTEFARSAGATVWLTGRLVRSPRKAFAENFPPSCQSWPWTTGGPAKRWECLELPEIARDCQIVETMMLQAPIIITPPTDTRGHVGANLTLDCEARGFPAPTISWQVELSLWLAAAVVSLSCWEGNILKYFESFYCSMTMWRELPSFFPLMTKTSQSRYWCVIRLSSSLQVEGMFWLNFFLLRCEEVQNHLWWLAGLRLYPWIPPTGEDCEIVWDCVRLCESVSLDSSYRWEAFH